MANYETLKSAIQQVVKTNGNNEITGALLQQSLLAMINSLGDGYQFMGIATTTTNPGIMDAKVFYIANGKGTYANFGGIVVDEDEVVILKYDFAWTKILTGIATYTDLSAIGIKQEELNNIINGQEEQPSVTINLSQYLEENAFPYGNVWLVNPQYKGKFIPCLPNRNYIFVGHSNNTSIFAFLTTNVYSSGGAVPYANGSAETSVLANETKTVISPNDATYLWISTQNGANKPNEPLSLTLGGEESKNGLLANFNDLSKFIYGVETQPVNINIAGYSEESNYIDGVNYFVNPYYKGRFIPCEGGAKYSFLTNSINVSSLAFLKSTDNVISGSTPDYATGWERAQAFESGQTLNLVAPLDANFIWVCSKRGTGKPCDFQSIIKLGETIKYGLASIAKYSSIAEQGFPQKDLPVISFVFDDIDDNDEEIVKLFNEYGIKCGFAFIASDEKLAANRDKYLEYQKQGFSILNHSVDGKIFNITNYPTIQSAYNAIMTAKQKLETSGFIVNGFVAPSSEFYAPYIDALRNTHQYAYTTADLANTRSSNPCNISRESLQSTKLANILAGENVQTSIAFHIAVNRQLTFYGHTADFGISYDGEIFNLAKIRNVVERCISLRNEGKCLILSPNEMANYFFRGQININSNVSGNRPHSPQTGMMFFDKTLNKPIWYNGTKWVDATGADA